MKIAYIATGAADMVCGTCIHDNTVAAAMQGLGHDVALIPTYTPIRTDEENVSMPRVFVGGLNAYLHEKVPLFRYMPSFVDSFLNSPRILNWLSKLSASTNAKELGELTVAMLQGEAGSQKKELLKLIEWLRDEYQPDIVHLNHTLLLGFAREMKRQLDVPVICGTQGEDLFLETLTEPYKTRATALMRERAGEIDALIATSRYYGDFMASYLAMPLEKVHRVYLGIKLHGHGDDSFRIKRDTVVIGYLARICPEKGLHLLVDAFHHLWQKYGTKKVQLKAAGYLGKKDEPFFRDLIEKIDKRGMGEAFEYLGELDRLQKIAFLSNIDILSVPTVYQESKGLSILEAMANSVPVVQPRHGNFPEVIEMTGGGLLFEPHSVPELVKALDTLIQDVTLREQLGAAGKQVVHRDFGDRNMALATLEVYEKYVKKEKVLSGTERARKIA